MKLQHYANIVTVIAKADFNVKTVYAYVNFLGNYGQIKIKPHFIFSFNLQEMLKKNTLSQLDNSNIFKIARFEYEI